MRPASRDEAGAATVLVVAMAGVLMFVAVALAGVSALVLAQRRAQAAADLAALAGAEALARAGDGCAASGRTAALNGARLESCVSDALEVRVSVSLPPPDLPGPVRAPPVTAQARAGPG